LRDSHFRQPETIIAFSKVNINCAKLHTKTTKHGILKQISFHTKLKSGKTAVVVLNTQYS